MYYKRTIGEEVNSSLENNPVTAILGARQVGKTTFAKKILEAYDNSLYIDLEKPSDRTMLNDPEQFFKINNNKIVCLDEIQLLPDIFPVLRSIIDDSQYNLKFILTGSSSPGLLRQSSESLAGRIAYFELSPFSFQEISLNITLEEYWLKGGFPLSILQKDNEQSFNWRKNFILTFLERDLNNFGFNIPPETLHRLWKMIAHINGQTINYSQLSNSLGVSDTTVRKYIDILTKTYVLKILNPYHANLKKRLIKSPKIYINDSGILNALLNISDYNEMLSHPSYGSSWELICIQNIVTLFKNWEVSFYKTSHGNELDLVLTKANKTIAFEFKTSTSPKVTKGFWEAIKDVGAESAYIIAPVKTAYPYKENVWVYPLSELPNIK